MALDDYHTLTNSYTHELLRILLQYLPQHFRLLLVTREDPPFQLNRMRVHGEMTEIRMKDLCLTVDEAKEFLQVMGLALRDEAVAICTERTEGWAAGLQLAALSLQGRDQEEIEAFLADFSGSNRYIIDYLVDEVLSRQEPAIREFLRLTAVLDRFTPQLCDKVTERNNSHEILRTIESSNLFLIPLDGQREWFRYHHLFSDSLQMEMGKAERAKVHLCAAKWYEDRRDLPEAVEQALAAGEMKEAARLIDAAAMEMLTQTERELAILRNWLESLPDEVLRDNGGLLAGKPWAQYLTGRHREAELFLLEIPAAQRADMAACDQGRLLSLEALIAFHRGDDIQAAGLAREALVSIAGKADLMSRASTLNTLGGSLARLGDIDGAELAFHEANELTKAFPQAFISVVTVSSLASLLDLRGRRREAETLCRRHYHLFLDEMGRPSAFGGILAVRLGIMAYEENELFQARLLLETGLELRRAIGYLEDMQGEESLALTLDALGEGAAAMEMLQAGSSRCASEDELFNITAAKAELNRRHGEMAAVMRWAEEWYLSPHDSPDMQRESGYLTYIRLLLDMGCPEQALAIVERMSAKSEAEGRLNRLIHFRVLQAVAMEKLGRMKEAGVALRQAVSIAAPEGYLRAFLDQGLAVAPLLPMIREKAPAFVDRLAAAFNVPKTGLIKIHPQIVETLTKRELELLKLLAEGLTNEEISRRLYISLNTTKWHLKSIFGKLMVGNRVQAVRCARDMGLL